MQNAKWWSRDSNPIRNAQCAIVVAPYRLDKRSRLSHIKSGYKPNIVDFNTLYFGGVSVKDSTTLTRIQSERSDPQLLFIIYYLSRPRVGATWPSALRPARRQTKKSARFFRVLTTLINSVHRLALYKALNIASENVHQPRSCLKACPGNVGSDNGFVACCKGVVCLRWL